MTKLRSAVGGSAVSLVVGFLLALAACSSGGGPARPSADPTPRAVPDATPGPVKDRAVSRGFEVVPRADLAAYLEALHGIAPELSANDVNAWKQGVFVCYKIYLGTPVAQVVAF